MKTIQVIEIIIFIGAITFSFLWITWQWNICREMGFPFWYCVQHIL